MKSRKAKIILSIFIALGMVTVTTDCAFQRMRENLKNCEFDLDSVSIKSLSFTSIELALDVGIKNPNAEQVILDKLVFDLYGSDRKLGSGKHNETAAITKPVKTSLKTLANTYVKTYGDLQFPSETYQTIQF